jgi:TetR/AcrR family transcriptional repressor of nem operon
MDTKQNLIDTALELIWKNSYGSVSVDDICRAADAKKGSFYYFFPSKADLAVAAIEESAQKSKFAYDRIFSAEKSPVQRFEDLADWVYESQHEVVMEYGRVCGCPCASLGSEMAGQEDKISAKVEEIAARQKRYYESALRDMVADGLLPAETDVKIKAQEVYTYLLGQFAVARIQNNLEPLKRDLKRGLLRTLGVSMAATAAA